MNKKTHDGSKRFIKLDLLRLIGNILILMILEGLKYRFGQDMESLIIYGTLFFLLLLSDNSKKTFYLAFWVFYIYEVTDTIVWWYNETSFNDQVLAALDYFWVWQNHPEFFIYISIFLCAGIILEFFPFISYYVNIDRIFIEYVGFLKWFLLYLSIRRFNQNFQLFDETEVVFRGLHNKGFNQLFHTPIQFNLTNPRNAIVMQVEAFETHGIHPLSTPFLYNLSQNSYYVNTIDSSPFTTWTAAGIMVTQCGLPELVTTTVSKIRLQDNISKYSRIPCTSDFLYKAGYSLDLYSVGAQDIMGISTFFANHHFNAHTCYSDDKDLYQKMTDNILPKLAKYPPEKKFYMIIMNENTHTPYRYNCKLEIPSSMHRIRKSHNCFDQNIRGFVKRFFELKLYETTDLIIYGDHLSPGMGIFPNPRKLFLMIANEKPIKVNKPMTYYDLPPTILKRLGFIDYQPHFIFGADINSSKVGVTPSKDDYLYLFHQASRINAFH